MNRWEKLFHQLADNREAETQAGRIAQSGMGAVASLYGAGAATNRFLHERGLRERRSLSAPVFSVGNITLGGTGKTPFTIWLARWLEKQGKPPVVLTRGYGREDEDELVVIHDGDELQASTREAGDEPVMIGRALGNVPVIACANRYRAGRMALRRFTVGAIVLDDGFQHTALERQADIVLIDATKPLSGLKMFPRGTLREPLSVLGRAHLLVLTRCDQAGRRANAAAKDLARRYPGTPVVRTRLAATGLRDLGSGEKQSVEKLKKARVLVVAGVAHPASVRKTLKSLGARVVRMASPGDHAEYTRSDVLKWDSLRRRMNADYVVVTSKDAVKLRELGSLPDHVVELRTALEFVTEKDRQRAEKALLGRLHARGPRGLLGKE